ncbi:MAG: hypothetical protein ABSA47_09490 [Verrucomicrobiota bacterium]|jgi:hypothetical protein
MNWLIFSLMTVVSWGLYGIFLHGGQVGMADKSNGLFKAFLFVGLAYFLTAVLAPLGILLTRRAAWSFPVAGMGWSLVAGIVGAVGAFCVLLAFSSKGSPGPSVVMSIVFGGAPVVNALVAIWLNPPKGGLGSIAWPFYLGILMAATGGCLVTFFKPNAGPAPAPKPAMAVVQSMPQSQP